MHSPAVSAWQPYIPLVAFGIKATAAIARNSGVPCPAQAVPPLAPSGFIIDRAAAQP